MTKQFLTKKYVREKKKNMRANKENKKLSEFYTTEQLNKEEMHSIEEQIFEHLKNHTKKVIMKNRKK